MSYAIILSANDYEASGTESVKAVSSVDAWKQTVITVTVTVIVRANRHGEVSSLTSSEVSESNAQRDVWNERLQSQISTFSDVTAVDEWWCVNYNGGGDIKAITFQRSAIAATSAFSRPARADHAAQFAADYWWVINCRLCTARGKVEIWGIWSPDVITYWTYCNTYWQLNISNDTCLSPIASVFMHAQRW